MKIQDLMIREQAPGAPSVGYHSSFTRNRESILKHGLDLKFSQGAELGAGEIYFSTHPHIEENMDIWKVDLRGIPLEYDGTQVTGEPSWHKNEHWWFTTTNIAPDRLTLFSDRRPFKKSP